MKVMVGAGLKETLRAGFVFAYAHRKTPKLLRSFEKYRKLTFTRRTAD